MPSLQIIDQENDDTTSSQTTKQPLCYICQEKASNYICPRCNLRYCSLACYKDQQHASCTETFYKDNVMAEMRSMDSEDMNKKSMQKILNKFEAENDQLDADEQQQSLVRNDNDNTLKTLEQRFEDMDIAKTDASMIWDLLSPQERHDFQALMKMDGWQGLDLPEYEPWWIIPVSIVTDLDGDDDDSGVSDIPPLPTAIPALSAIMKSPPAPHLIFHLLHVLMSYAYLARQTMDDLADDIEYGVQSMGCLSRAVLFSTVSNGNNTFHSIGDVLTDLGRQINHLNHDNTTTITSTLDRTLLKDAEGILTHGRDYAIRALGELYQLLDHGSKDKTIFSAASAPVARKKVGLAARKAYFFMAYANHLKQSQEDNEQQQVELLVMALQTEYKRLQHDQDVFDAQRKVAKDALTERKNKDLTIGGGKGKMVELL